ncbi:hypothetical protein PAMP_015726 [Pampus punctatissimus]
MRKLSVQDKVCIVICWALMLMYSVAEREYFPQSTDLTWDEARNHCQVCFKDLTTLTPANIHNIALKLVSNSTYWVGLRKNFNSTSDSSIPWTRWANGDPLTFQNWYPGWPVLKPATKSDCCSCSCSCPAVTNVSQNITHNITLVPQNMSSSPEWGTNTTQYTTSVLTEATCTPTPMMSLDELDTDQYIEDSCVAMLSFGGWVERNCLELLPFICYEDDFIGEVNVTNLTSTSANFTWPTPDNINYYRVEVKGDMNLIENQTSLTYDIFNLTEGADYSVQVFPVKCGRELKPLNVTFYTIPNKVGPFTITVNETSVFLKWSKPAGKVHSYRIYFLGEPIQSTVNTKTTISNLTPGNFYTFTVRSVAGDNCTMSEPSSITTYTKPGKVTDLKVSENTNSSLQLNWVPPDGNFTGFRVTATSDNIPLLFITEVEKTQNQVTITDLPMGSLIMLNVTTLLNDSVEGDSVEGDKVTVVSYTVPGMISNLNLIANTASTISAKWDAPQGSYVFFKVQLWLDGTNKTSETFKPHKDFPSLKNAAKYTVIVYSVNNIGESLPVEASKFTLPLPPTDLSVYDINKTSMSFKWKAPVNVATVTYKINLTSSFWEQTWTHTLVNKTNYIFTDLNAGTKYNFKVQTVAESLSEPVLLTSFTVPDKTELTLSMMCSSLESLACDREKTRKDVLNQLKSHIKKLFNDDIFWDLKLEDGSTIA